MYRLCSTSCPRDCGLRTSREFRTQSTKNPISSSTTAARPFVCRCVPELMGGHAFFRSRSFSASSSACGRSLRERQHPVHMCTRDRLTPACRGRRTPGRQGRLRARPGGCPTVPSLVQRRAAHRRAEHGEWFLSRHG